MHAEVRRCAEQFAAQRRTDFVAGSESDEIVRFRKAVSGADRRAVENSLDTVGRIGGQPRQQRANLAANGVVACISEHDRRRAACGPRGGLPRRDLAVGIDAEQSGGDERGVQVDVMRDGRKAVIGDHA